MHHARLCRSGPVQAGTETSQSNCHGLKGVSHVHPVWGFLWRLRHSHHAPPQAQQGETVAMSGKIQSFTDDRKSEKDLKKKPIGSKQTFIYSEYTFQSLLICLFFYLPCSSAVRSSCDWRMYGVTFAPTSWSCTNVRSALLPVSKASDITMLLFMEKLIFCIFILLIEGNFHSCTVLFFTFRDNIMEKYEAAVTTSISRLHINPPSMICRKCQNCLDSILLIIATVLA